MNQSQEHYGSQSVKQNELSHKFMDMDIAKLFSMSHLQEEEILLLRKQTTDANFKEQQLLKEKHILERKLIDLRMALDEKTRNAAADAIQDLAFQKEYLEENLRLSNEMKVMDDERFLLTSSLLSLLAEFDIRPSVINATDICNGIKRLYQQLQMRPMISHVPNAYEYHPYGQRLRDTPMESTSSQSRFVHEHDTMGSKDTTTTANTGGQYPFVNKRSSDVKDSLAFSPEKQYAKQMERKPSFRFNITPTHQTNASYDSEDEMIPGIESFQITGDARPGSTLRACGFQTNGTTLCVFQWVRHFQDGTRQYIDGATNTDYVVTADDVDKHITVECIPMNDSGRQGEMVKLSVNNNNKIRCDPEMQRDIQTHATAGQAVFNVFLLRDSSEVWEPATLILKKFSYEIKINHARTVEVEEKYSFHMSIKVPHGLSTQFVLTRSDGASIPFSTNGTTQASISENDIRLRDIIVLTVRIFQSKALGKAPV